MVVDADFVPCHTCNCAYDAQIPEHKIDGVFIMAWMNKIATLSEYGVIMLICLVAFAAVLVVFSGPLKEIWTSISEMIDFNFDKDQTTTESSYSEERIAEGTSLKVDPVAAKEWLFENQFPPFYFIFITAIDKDKTPMHILRTIKGWEYIIIAGDETVHFTGTSLADVLKSNDLVAMLQLDGTTYIHMPWIQGMVLEEDDSYLYVEKDWDGKHDKGEGVWRLNVNTENNEQGLFWYIDINNDETYSEETDQRPPYTTLWFPYKKGQLIFNKDDAISSVKIAEELIKHGINDDLPHLIDQGNVIIIKQPYNKGWNLMYDQDEIRILYTNQQLGPYGYPSSYTLLENKGLAEILDSDFIWGAINIEGKVYVHSPDKSGSFIWYFNKDDNIAEYDSQLDEKKSTEDMQKIILASMYLGAEA